MEPSVHPGDYVVANIWAYRFRRPRRGEVVLVRDPETRTRVLLKRVASVSRDGEIVVVGDNPERSRDSRQFGAVSRSDVIGKAWIRVRP